MSRPWRSLPLLCAGLAACNSTIDPEPPTAYAFDVRAMALSNTHTYAVTELAANTLDNVVSFGTDVPQPHDASTGEPVPLMLPAARDIAVGRAHACVLSATGSVHCWGDHLFGALGNHRACLPPAAEGGAPDCILGALVMPSLPPSRDIVAAGDVTCAITDEDRVVCWGEAGPALGGSVLPALDPPTPVRLPSGESLVADKLVMGRGAVCAIDKLRALWCWGERFGAQPVLQPQRGVVDFALGERHDCIIDERGLACWGDNTNGQVGDFRGARACTGKSCFIEEPLVLDIDARRVVVGERHTCALRADGAVACWGSNEVGQLGRDDAFLVGDRGLAISDTVDIAAGYAHTCALRRDQSLWCWGSTTVYDAKETR